ncbi:MAG: thioredoxin domain-containing protein, partial [Patescibacteria group bacterium]
IVWKDMPNETRHSEAIPSAIAARCAGKQGKFWEFNAQLFANQSTLSSDLYQTIAADVGLDTPSFSLCVSNEDTLPLVERTLAEGLALKITATPTLFINNERFTGSLSQSEIDRAISAAMVK